MGARFDTPRFACVTRARECIDVLVFWGFLYFVFSVRANRVRDARVRTLGRRGWRGSGFEPGYIILRNGKE